MTVLNRRMTGRVLVTLCASMAMTATGVAQASATGAPTLTWYAPCNSLSEWRSIQIPAGTTDRLQIVPDPLGKRKSPHALRVEVRDGDVAVNSKGDPIPGGWRAEVVGPTETQSSTTVRYSWSTMLDPAYPVNPKGSDGKPIWQVITQWHQGDADMGASPPIALIIVNKEILLHLNKPDGTEVGQYRVADLAQGSWHDFQMDVRWALSGGTVTLWHNGQLVPGIPSAIQTLFPQRQNPAAAGTAILKMGLYRKAVPTPVSGQFVLYHDEVKRYVF